MIEGEWRAWSSLACRRSLIVIGVPTRTLSGVALATEMQACIFIQTRIVRAYLRIEDQSTAPRNPTINIRLTDK
jgi:hypothetical protein